MTITTSLCVFVPWGFCLSSEILVTKCPQMHPREDGGSRSPPKGMPSIIAVEVCVAAASSLGVGARGMAYSLSKDQETGSLTMPPPLPQKDPFLLLGLTSRWLHSLGKQSHQLGPMGHCVFKLGYRIYRLSACSPLDLFPYDLVRLVELKFDRVLRRRYFKLLEYSVDG